MSGTRKGGSILSYFPALNAINVNEMGIIFVLSQSGNSPLFFLWMGKQATFDLHVLSI